MDGSPVVHKAECQHFNDAGDVDSCKQICDLPRAIILCILAFLPIEDAVRTSVLLRWWEYLWTSIPSIVFNEDHYCGNMPFGNFLERVLLLCDLSSIKAFSLTCMVDKEVYYDGNESRVNSWITAAIRRNVEELCLHLTVDCRDTVYMLPHCMFRCETLRELHLEMNHDLKLPSSVCLTNLKVLCLTEVWFEDDNSVEKLLLCPSLEKLSVDCCIWDLEVLQISAPNLLYLTIVEEVLLSSYQNSQVRIHGASVKSFDYFGLFLYDYIVLTSSSLVEASIQVWQEQISIQGTYRLYKFLKALSNVKQLLFYIREEILKSFPIFHNLTKLELNDIHKHLEPRALLLLLGRCPILNSYGVVVASKNDDWISDTLPPCFTSSLKEIVICCFQGSNSELLALRIFLRTAAVLEKLLIYCLNGHLWCYQGNMMEHLNELPRASNQCIILLEEGHCSTIRKRREFDDM
ncbi:hypothetical protein BT93_D0783 [Corymbia citriodora subsp. variegata]|nr:hypothetical protein BT93_D0783 [Corymbia citriodora subsp. variegata]